MPSIVYPGAPYFLPARPWANRPDGLQSRYFQSQGLFTVPTQIVLVIAPINAVLNYFLGIKVSLRDIT